MTYKGIGEYRAITLTTGVDVLTGTANNDTFVATDSTYNTGDSLTGGAGTDTLGLTLGGANTAVVTLSGVENVSINDYSGVTVNGANWTGVTGLVFGNSTAATTVNNVAAIPTVTLNKTAHNVTVTLNASTVAGASDAATITMNGLTDNAKTVTLNGIETLTLNAITADSKFRVADTGLKALVVTGDKQLDVSAAALNTTVTSVDASAKTAGGFLADLTGSTLTSVKGGLVTIPSCSLVPLLELPLSMVALVLILWG